MSYDLYFYKSKDSKLTEKEVAEYLSGNIPHNISESNKQWDYENPDTGSYFIIDWQDSNNEDDEKDTVENFENFEYLNFYFYINFFRPRFFGLEIFPLIEKIVDDLDLYVLNPQDFENADSPQKFKKGELLENWIKTNDQVSTGPHEGFTLEYMPLDKSNSFWWYQLHKTELENSITEDIYIPNVLIVKSGEDNLLYTACAWTNHIPLLLPKVDFLIIQKKYKRLFKTIEQSGVITYEYAMEKLGHYFKDFEFDVPDLKILYQTESDKMEKEFNNLEILKPVKEFGTAVGKDGFVNVPQ